MLVGRRYRMELNVHQSAYAENTGAICRAAWNLALEQRRAAAELHCRQQPTSAGQQHELAELKRSEPWLAEAPSHCLQQTLRDLDKACRAHGPWRVHFRARRRWEPSFRFPDPLKIGTVRRLSRRWGEVKLPKLGTVRFRFVRDLAGEVRNVTVQRDGGHWYITFCIEDHLAEPAPNGLPAVGIDRGVVVTVATSDGECFNGVGMRPDEQLHLRHLQRRLARQKKGSVRRRRTVRAIGRVHRPVRDRRADFCHQTAHTLTTKYGLIVVEDLRVKKMTAAARGTVEKPGTNVRQKAGLNRSILDKSWGRLRTSLEWHGRKHGCELLAVPAAYTSQTCSNCGYVAEESRESQADFCCVACDFQANADVNAAKIVLALGLRASGRGGLAAGPPMKRQPLVQKVAHAAA